MAMMHGMRHFGCLTLLSLNDYPPREEHKKRSKRACPLFASGPSSKSHHEEHSIPVKSQDGDADELGRSTAQKTPRRQTKKTTGAKTPAAKGRSKSKPPPVQDVDEDEDVEPEQSKPAPPIKQKRQTRQISVKRSQTKSDEERAEESEVMSLAVEYQDPGSSVASKKAAGKRKPKATEQHPRPESDMEEQSAFHPSQSTTSNPRSGSTRPTRTIVRSEDEAQAAVTEDEPVTAAMPPPKSHNRTRSTSAMSAVDPPPRPPKSPSRRLGKAKGKLPPSDVSDDDEETPTPLPVAKPKSTRTRSQSRAPSESESERPARLTRKGSKAKVASDAEDAEDEPARKRKTVTRKASKAKAIVADTEEDNEADSSTSAASKAKLSKSKGKSSELLSAIAKATAHVPSPVKEVDEEDLSMNIHIPPPSPSPMPKPKPSAIKRAPSFVDLAELSKPKAKSQKKTADFIPTKSASKPIKQTPQDFFGASQLADHSQESKRGAETSDEEPPQKRVAKPPLPMAHEEKQITRESALRVVDISSDEDSPMKPQAKPKKHLPQPSPPRVAPETMTEPSILDEDIEIPVELPQTPPRRAAPVILPSSPMAVEADIERAPFPSTPATRTDPEFYPPLSTEPYVNATSFTDDELDMTVEDWILQQVEQQLTKFKLDGEIFLQQIEKEAESKRMAIEALN